MATDTTITEGSGAAAIVAALLLPPLGVFLAHGIGRDFWISVLLTCLAWVPGVIFSLWSVLRGTRALSRA